MTRTDPLTPEQLEPISRAMREASASSTPQAEVAITAAIDAGLVVRAEPSLPQPEREDPPSEDVVAGRETCPRCKGKGELEDGPEIEGESFITRCPRCHGTGTVLTDKEASE